MLAKDIAVSNEALALWDAVITASHMMTLRNYHLLFLLLLSGFGLAVWNSPDMLSLLVKLHSHPYVVLHCTLGMDILLNHILLKLCI